jgi:O-antigen/teichoic acid export membrane protein
MIGGDFLRHGAMVLAASVLMNVCNYLFHVLNSRKLGVEGYGELASLVAMLVVLSFPSAALTLGVAKLAAELHAVNDREGIRKLVDVLCRWGGILGVGFIALAVVTLPWSTRFLKIDDYVAILLTAAAIAINLVSPALRAVLQGVEDFWAFARSIAIEGIFKVVLGVGLTYAGYGVDGALGGFLGGAVVSCGYILFTLRPHVAAHESRLTVDLRRLTETAAGIGVASLAFSILNVVDVVAVKHFMDPYTAGLYGGLSLVGKIFLFAVAFIPQVLLPKVVRRNSLGGDSAHYLLYSVAATGVVGAIGIAICVVVPWLVIRLVAGVAFTGIAALLVPYALAMTFLAVATTASTYRIGAHRLGFGVPLLLVTCAELVAFAFMHAQLADIVRTVVIGHLMVALVTLYGAVPRRVTTAANTAEVAA